MRGDWDPLKEMLNVQKRLNTLFESALARTDFEAGEGVGGWTPVSDVFETAEQLVLALELPGLEQKQIELRVEGDELVIEGERAIDREGPGERFHRVERSHGRFSRRFRIPAAFDREAVSASYRNGLLRITLPRRSEAGPESIRVSID